MDEPSLAALRRSSEVELERARHELARRHDELSEARAELELGERSREAITLERARWEEGLRALAGHTLSGLELADLRRRGEAIEARARDIARRHAAARSLLAKAESALEQGRQAVGEALARQRWIEEESRRGSLARERQATLREDED